MIDRPRIVMKYPATGQNMKRRLRSSLCQTEHREAGSIQAPGYVLMSDFSVCYLDFVPTGDKL